MTSSPDAVVVGAGPNGLVAANLLVDAGLDVVVLEAQAQPGGAVRSGEITRPGYTSDLFSAFYPLAAASPIIASLGLEDFGLRWVHAPEVLAHPLPDGSCALLSLDVDTTAASVDSFAAGDGDAWREMVALWRRVSEPLLGALFSPFPPVRSGAALAAALGPRQLMRFLRVSVLPVRRFIEERFSGKGAALLVAGNAMHTDLAPESAASGLYGFVLTCLAQEYGFPVPEGGAGRLSDALAARLVAKGGELRCATPVEEVTVRAGKAVGVRTAAGEHVAARRAVLADTSAPALYGGLVRPEHLPARVLEDIKTFQFDASTIKVDWALDAPIPWKAEEARRAGTIHVADDLDHLSEFGLQLVRRLIPDRPFLIMGQMTTADPTRSPAGTECAWAYAHVPQETVGDAGGELTGTWDEREAEIFAGRMEDRIEELAPGFKDLVGARHVFSPRDMEAANANLVGGALNGGTAQIHQQLIFRPISGLARPETPIGRLYLASSSAHPGGGVHGAPGANAARAVLARRKLRRAALVTAAGAAALAVGARRR